MRSGLTLSERQAIQFAYSCLGHLGLRGSGAPLGGPVSILCVSIIFDSMTLTALHF